MPFTKGHIPSIETRLKISNNTRIAMQNPLIKARLSQASKGRTPWNKGMIGLGKGRKHTDESKKLMSIKAKGRIITDSQKEKLRIANLGKKQSKETIEKRASKLRGKPRSSEIVEKIRRANMGRIVSIETRAKIGKANKNRIGRKHTEEAILKMSLAKKGKSRPDMLGKRYFLGYKHTEEAKKRIGFAAQKLTGERNHRFGKPSTFKGRKHSLESRNKMSQKLKGRTGTFLGKHHSKETIEKLKIIRSKQIGMFCDTKIEIKMQEILNSLNIKYQKHFPTYHQDMGYHQVDIMICDHEGNPKIAIECDGCYWHGCPIHHPNSKHMDIDRDRIIDTSLTKLGIKVIRFWEHDIKNNMVPLELLR